MSKAKKPKVEAILRDITKIFGLDPKLEPDHKVALEEVKNSLKKHLG